MPAPSTAKRSHEFALRYFENEFRRAASIWMHDLRTLELLPHFLSSTSAVTGANPDVTCAVKS